MLYRAKRDCNPGGTYYRQGQIVDFAERPDPDLFEAAGRCDVAGAVTEAPNPGGRVLNEDEKKVIAKAARPKVAPGSINAGK